MNVNCNMDKAYCIIKYNTINKLEGRILSIEYSFEDIYTVFCKCDFNGDKDLYSIIECDKKYVEYIGMSMRDSDLDFKSGEFNERTLVSGKK